MNDPGPPNPAVLGCYLGLGAEETIIPPFSTTVPGTDCPFAVLFSSSSSASTFCHF